MSAEANKLPAIHIAGNDGVTFFKTCTAEVFRPIPYAESRSLQTQRDPQGLRRPRFSFFIFTCQTARGPRTPLPNGSLPSETFQGRVSAPHSTTNDNRFPPAVDSLISVRSFTGTKTCLGRGPRQRRAQWAGYKPARSALSTVVVNKSSHHATESRTAKKSRFLGALRRT